VANDPVNWFDPEGLSGIVVPFPWIEPIIRPIPMPMFPIDPAFPIPLPDIDPSGSGPNPANEYCQSLLRRIENTRDEIYNKRYPDLESNPLELPERIGPGEKLCETVRGHEKLLNRRLRELRKLEDEYDKKCPGIRS